MPRSTPFDFDDDEDEDDDGPAPRGRKRLPTGSPREGAETHPFLRYSYPRLSTEHLLNAHPDVGAMDPDWRRHPGIAHEAIHQQERNQQMPPTPFRKGDKVKFTVEGEVEAAGVVRIGCRNFTEGDIRSFATDIVVTPPPKPSWQAGDLINKVRGTQQGLRRRNGLGEWWDINGTRRVHNDVSVEDDIVNGTYVAVVRGGQIQREAGF